MSKAGLVITAVTVEKRPVSDVARSYGVARSWIHTLLARYQAEADAAFEPRSRRPKSSPSAISPDVVSLIVRLRKELAGQALRTGCRTGSSAVLPGRTVGTRPWSPAWLIEDRAGLSVPRLTTAWVQPHRDKETER
jgi:hypothetical protein